ncbi:MAG: hypothetical protein AB7N91_06515 [Candidatus Tectimicrobiota bacterium]
MPDRKQAQRPIVLTSHPGPAGRRPWPIVWGAPEPGQRGPLIATLNNTRLPLPEERLPQDARVAMVAKQAAGYDSHDPQPNAARLAHPMGRVFRV